MSGYPQQTALTGTNYQGGMLMETDDIVKISRLYKKSADSVIATEPALLFPAFPLL